MPKWPKWSYITTAEKIGIEKGEKIGEKKGKTDKAQEDIGEALKIRFGTVPKRLVEKIKEIRNNKKLSSFHRKAILVKDLKEFEQFINKALN